MKKRITRLAGYLRVARTAPQIRAKLVDRIGSAQQTGGRHARSLTLSSFSYKSPHNYTGKTMRRFFPLPLVVLLTCAMAFTACDSADMDSGGLFGTGGYYLNQLSTPNDEIFRGSGIMSYNSPGIFGGIAVSATIDSTEYTFSMRGGLVLFPADDFSPESGKFTSFLSIRVSPKGCPTNFGCTPPKMGEKVDVSGRWAVSSADGSLFTLSGTLLRTRCTNGDRGPTELCTETDTGDLLPWMGASSFMATAKFLGVKPGRAFELWIDSRAYMKFNRVDSFGGCLGWCL